MTPRTSVEQRLVLLVGSQTAIAALLVLMAFGAIARLSADTRYMYEFQLIPIAEIGRALANAAALQAHPATAASHLTDELNDFYRRYRELWEGAHGNTADAGRFRKDLLKSGNSGLLERETKALMDLEKSLRLLKRDTAAAGRVRADLAALHDVNVDFADVAHRLLAMEAQAGRVWLFAIGILGIVLTLLLGLFVHRAISPRIQRLVAKVRYFQESGVNEKIVENGKDEIAVLANALDAGFNAIAARERQREEFLAIAAHELKTPITSIQGYASLLLNHPEQAALIPRAIEIIHRQSWRLSRLVEDLFLAMRARSGDLQFQPEPLDLSALVLRLSTELKPHVSHGVFSFEIADKIKILGDEALLEHAIWSLFTCASALSPKEAPVEVKLSAAGAWARLAIDVEGSRTSADEIEALFIPFRSVQYESGSGIRAAVGLYLCREIVRVHNGRLRVSDVCDTGPEFLMELPA